MTLPALSIKCECQECQRHRRDLAWQHAYYIKYNGADVEVPAWVYGTGLDPSGAEDPLCSGGCETHRECSDHGLTCGHCGECDSLCQCAKCSNCGDLADSCECCSECGSSYCGTCGNCDESECNCSCESEDSYGSSGGSSSGFGSVTVAPWSARGYRPSGCTDYRSWSEVWGVDRNTDLCRSAADFYLLEALAGGVVNHGAPQDAYLSMLRSEARGQLADLVAKLDKTFTGYVDAIIGGELRHHRASGSLRHHGRKDAWLEWHAIREEQGTEALADAVDLFLDFNSNGYGGEAWATIARVLLARLTGTISPATFVDRVFSLQHNGGSLFDKGSWGVENGQGWSYYELNTWILPAHGRNPEPAWTLLLAVASDEVRELFRATWDAGNSARRKLGTGGYRAAPSGRLPMTTRRDHYYGTTTVEVDGHAMVKLLQGLDAYAA